MHNRDKLYEWQKGDTLSLVALKHCQKVERYKELEDHNKRVLLSNRYQLKPGDIIQIPESWFPIPSVSYGTRFEGNSIRGHRT